MSMPLRRAQLIAPFGVGALVVNKQGHTLVTAGLDYWYRIDNTTSPREEDLAEFKLREWRLEAQLGVRYFRVPPDFRTKGEAQNKFMQIPMLRFPTWHVCPRCGLMRQVNASNSAEQTCAECAAQKFDIVLHQLPMVVACAHGHMTDFPVWEWVHRRDGHRCGGQLRYHSGGYSLAANRISCSCEGGTRYSRSLDGVLEMKTLKDGRRVSVLSDTLYGAESDRAFTCRGERAWFDEQAPRLSCGEQLVGAHTSAMNAYFADVRSAIYLPRDIGATITDDLLRTLESPAFSEPLEDARKYPHDLAKYAQRIMARDAELRELGEATIVKALEHLLSQDAQNEQRDAEDSDPLRAYERDVAFRQVEQEVLRQRRAEDAIFIEPREVKEYRSAAPYLGHFAQVRKLRETRVLAGFTRITGMANTSDAFRRALMWRDPEGHRNDWLPAHIVHGEGLYFELDPARLSAWERQDNVKRRVQRLAVQQEKVRQKFGDMPDKATPRFVLLHTIAHLLIRELTFSCGYASASLRERLYVSPDDAPGLLIYTASGDSDGSLGGLVRQGEPERFERTLLNALQAARWCSNDPVCMESVQGPNSLNLAACHSCTLISETSCEEFNTMLDRALVIGVPEDPSLGFFAQHLTLRQKWRPERSEA